MSDCSLTSEQCVGYIMASSLTSEQCVGYIMASSLTSEQCVGYIMARTSYFRCGADDVNFVLDNMLSWIFMMLVH
jgi:hypothetical protein